LNEFAPPRQLNRWASSGNLLMRPNLHDILHRRLYITLGLCVTLLIVTLLSSGFSIVYCAIGVAVGLVDSVIEIDELTGGKIFSAFSLPLLFAGGFVAALVSKTGPTFGLEMQYMLVVFCVDMLVTLFFRGPIERFVARRRSVP
jgi:hypothetical protein